MTEYHLYVEEDPSFNHLYLEMDEVLIEHMDLLIGDVLIWKDNGDGTWTIKKKERSNDKAN